MFAVVAIMASPNIYAPTLSAPANNAQGIQPAADLKWSPVAGLLGLYYEINLSLTEDFAIPIVYTTDLSSFKAPNLLFGKQYYWRVRAIDNSGSSEWSSVRSFTVLNTVVIKTPAANATNVLPNVEISWNSIAGVSFIDYQLDTTAAFNSSLLKTVAIAGNITGSKTNASSLLFDQKYYLRLRARNANDTSGWSDVRSFTVIKTVTLKTPTNNANSIAPLTALEWTRLGDNNNPTGGLTKYQILVSMEPDMGHYDIYNAPVTSAKVTPDTLLYGTNYYWQVAAIHTADTMYSDVWKFTTSSKVTLNAPANNSTNVELQPNLVWNVIPGSILYNVEISKNNNFENAFSTSVNAPTGTTATARLKVPLHIMDSANVYYWRVRAISKRDTSEFSNTWNLRTVTLGIEEASQLRAGVKIYPSPASSKVNISVKNTYNGMATVEIYDLLGNRKVSSDVMISNGFYKDFPVSNLSNGVYMISIIMNNQRITSKLIIQK